LFWKRPAPQLGHDVACAGAYVPWAQAEQLGPPVAAWNMPAAHGVHAAAPAAAYVPTAQPVQAAAAAAPVAAK
jgi:hypothetical protein